MDRWFRQVNFSEDAGLGRYVVKAYEEVDRSKMAANIGIYKMNCGGDTQESIKDLSVTTSRYDLVGGSRSSLHTPKALITGKFEKEQTICTFTETAIMSGIMSMSIKAPIRIDSRFSYCFDEVTKVEQLALEIDADVIDSRLSKMTLREIKKQSGLNMAFANSQIKTLKPVVMNHFMKHVMKQVEFCSVIKGYIQLSSFSLIGIRDIFQALEGVLFYEKDVARAKMLEALNYVTKEGRCPRQYIPPTEKGQLHSMDLRPFIDQGAWVITAIVNYLKFTKDYDFLRVPCGYYEFVDEHKQLARQDDGEDSVLTHMIAIMAYLLKNRDIGHTECVFALYGDWNDALDGLGNTKESGKSYGTGVSVMATLQVVQNLDEMLELLNLLNKKRLYFDDGLIDTYIKTKATIADGLEKFAIVEKDGIKKILHGWGDHRSYTVGGFEDPDGLSRDGLTSNAFWLLSDMIRRDEGMKPPIIEAFKRLKGKYGLKTFEPHFETNVEGVGRIPNLPAGTAENGATYIHASLFGVMAMFMIGESHSAWLELEKLLPFTHEMISCSPFVMPNSYGFNEDLNIDGESMADWQTGSSNVLLKLMIRFVLGFEPHYEGIYLQPAEYCPFTSFEYEIDYKNTLLKVSYKHTGYSRKYTVNGKVMVGHKDDLMGIKKLWLEDEYFKGAIIEVIITD